MQAAKEKAATQMLAYLEGRSLNVEFPPKEKRGVINRGDPENKMIWLQHSLSSTARFVSFVHCDTNRDRINRILFSFL